MRIINIGIEWAGFLVELHMWLERRKSQDWLLEYLHQVNERGQEEEEMGCTETRVSMHWVWVSVGHGVSQKVTCGSQKLERVWGLKTSFGKTSVLQGLVKNTGIDTVPCEESSRPTRERSAMSGTWRSPVRWDLEKRAFKLSVTGLLTVQGQQSHWKQSHQRLEAEVRLQWVEQ